MMATEIILRPACPSDMFKQSLKLIPNKLYFEFSFNCMELHGPFTTSPYPSDDENVEFYEKLFFNKQCVWIPDYDKRSSITTLEVKMRLANADDLKVSSWEKRVNYTYFLYEKNKFLGPFTLMEGTNPADIKKYLDEERIFVIDSAFKQVEFRNNKKAS